MAAPAPAAPAPAAEDAPAAKRQRLAKTEVEAWTPPAVTHTWRIEGLTVASFTGAASDDQWDGPEFEACGLRWRLFVQPNDLDDKERACFSFCLELLDRTLAPVQLGEAKLRVRGVSLDYDLSDSLFFVDAGHQEEDGEKIEEVDEDAGKEADGDAHEEDEEEEEEDEDEEEEEEDEDADDADEDANFHGYRLTHAALKSKADAILEGGVMVISVTLRSRCFSDLGAPKPLGPKLPALSPNRQDASSSWLRARGRRWRCFQGCWRAHRGTQLHPCTALFDAARVALGAPRSQRRSERVAASRA